MHNFLVLLNLLALSASELVKKAIKVATGVEKNLANFPNMKPTPNELRTEATLLDNLLQEKDSLETQLSAVNGKVNIHRKKLNIMLKAIGGQVEAAANEQQNAALISGAGFDSRSRKTHTSTIDVPNNLRLQEVPQTSGALLVIFEAVPKARNYGLAWAYGSVPPAEWSATAMHVVTTSRGSKISFESGQRVWVRVKAYGPNNIESAWSDVASRIVP